MGVQDLEEISNFILPLSEIEYEYVHKPEFKERRFFRKGLWGQGTCHLHICKFNSNEWIEKLLFRDYLRLNPDVAKEYAALKKYLLLIINSIDQPIQRKKNRLSFFRRIPLPQGT